MKAEERAKMLVRLIQGRQESWDWHADNIASAIRSAENEALERAANVMRESRDRQTQLAASADEDRKYALRATYEHAETQLSLAASDIRALKHEEP